MATVSEAEQLFPDLDHPERILVELKSLGLRAMEILGGFRDYCIASDSVKFWNLPPGCYMTTSWVVGLPNGKEFGVFENTGASAFLRPW